ncbi:nucleotidyltransferase domain-containing protein [Sporomusa sp.]|uniref:nucleotidyltransferase family protein n=1 Tax=Sporomusa sp. TaxID=2078658 RepID=UPI002C9B8CDB|nr:nucleotidyltransferase domain-containing protein [Sporomusa sp.]HWR45822.1 nucleotidyltransferase domain-containing protein [Sporomusa sp.]
MNKSEILQEVKNIVFSIVKDLPVEVYLFGSWARCEARRTSDIDLAIVCREGVDDAIISDIRTALEDSIVPYRVDVVNLSKADPVLLTKVQREGIVWND